MDVISNYALTILNTSVLILLTTFSLCVAAVTHAKVSGPSIYGCSRIQTAADLVLSNTLTHNLKFEGKETSSQCCLKTGVIVMYRPKTYCLSDEVIAKLQVLAKQYGSVNKALTVLLKVTVAKRKK